MKILSDIEDRLVYDWRNVMKWRSAQFATGGALFAALAFSLSLSSAGMQFIGVFGVRAALGICLLIFVSAFLGRIWRQKPSAGKDDDTDQAGA